MKSYNFWNNLTGWGVFTIATVVYLLTMEPSSSLWDCSEFIATSYKLEVGHPPGAPLFMIMARIATMFAPSTHYVPHMVNAMNCIASGFTILFLFWTISHLVRKMFTRDGREFSEVSQWLSVGAGAIGALAYTFTDTFWFSAVEGEVYALSSMFTALVVWLMLKWEDEADEPHSSRWIILIAYLMGLSIGVHILNLLTIPALVFIFYFRKWEKITLKGVIAAFAVAGVILLFINVFVLSYSIYLGALVDLVFVNGFGLPVNSGIATYALALIIGLGYASYVTHKKGKVLLNIVLLSLTMLFVGYSSYASVTIRAVANPPMNSNNPNNPYALLSLLNRDQYGARPLLSGASYAAPILDYEMKDTHYLDDNGKYSKTTNVSGYIYAEEFIKLFPRMWNPNKGEAGYKPWAAYRKKVEPARDSKGNIMRNSDGTVMMQQGYDYGKTVTYQGRQFVEPTLGENINFFFNYQLNYMFWRYFLWNFVGRQSDIQASSVTIADGNWMSGIKAIDQAYIGPQENLPREIENNRGRNKYYFLPFILGVVGLLYHLNKDSKNFSIVMLLFILMGVALVVYFNTSPSEPRERDYVYAGAFYAFSMWIGVGVVAIWAAISKALKGRGAKMSVAAATLISLSVPLILASENWDDHDRSHRTIARDIGWNYLQNTLPNSIIINYGDNDTFPLWFNQEVDEVRMDVRIMNSSYLGGAWYIDEMKVQSNESDPVPFSLPRNKYTNTNDMVPVDARVNRPIEIKEVMEFIKSNDRRTQFEIMDGVWTDYIPTKSIAIPVNKENAIASGIVKAEDAHLMVDTIYFELPNSSVDKSQLMMLDMLASFDWKRPIFFTQVYILQNLGLLDYLQYDGYAYRFVPILTPVTNAWEIGRIDPEYASKMLMETFRYGNLSDPRVYVDSFIYHNINASKARESFARVANEYARMGDRDKAIELLDAGLERLPTSQIRFAPTNTIPHIESYYFAGAHDKGDALLREYAENLIEYIEYYITFEGEQARAIDPLLNDKLGDLEHAYTIASYNKRKEVVDWLNEYFKSLGATDSDLHQIE
ncbi:MAG: DUF2723 domain-containing protein [Rikenellaceae bacterium]